MPAMETLRNPRLEVSIDLPDGRPRMVLSRDCPACDGHGSPCGECSFSGRLEQEVDPKGLRRLSGVLAVKVRMKLKRLAEELESG